MVGILLLRDLHPRVRHIDLEEEAVRRVDLSPTHRLK